MGVKAARRPARPDPYWPVRDEGADHARPTRSRSMTPVTTLASDGLRPGATAAGILPAPGQPTSSDTKLSAGMTATLFAQLEEEAAIGLVADIVRGVLDESRQGVRDRAPESVMVAARRRLERLIRAGSSLPRRSKDRPGMGSDTTVRPRSAG